MHRMIPAFFLAAGLRAGVIQGVVMEQASGRPLARALVRLEPVPKSAGGEVKPFTMRSGRTGHFAFSDIQPGSYLLVAINEGYFPAAYGQRLPVGHGRPIEVTTDTNIFAELRMRHKGAITGRVLDENGVGTAGVSVIAYRARMPLRSAGSATSDDRGVYRIAGLEPGKYWVRSAAHTLADGSGWLPTFGPQGREIRDARLHQVNVDADTTDADLSPEAGALFHLSGLIQCDTEGPVTVTLSTETGRKIAKSGCRMQYRFDGLAPAVYEVFAVVQDGSAAGFTDLFLDRDNDAGNVPVLQMPVVNFEMIRSNGARSPERTIRISARRQDLSESEAARDITQTQVSLAPGHWEMRAQPPRGQYVVDMQGMAEPRRPWTPQRPTDWFDLYIQPKYMTRIRVVLSDRPGQITGKVMTDEKPVAAAPVFLWPVAEPVRRSLAGSLQALSTIEGKFRFEGLPPGDYRILASFDLNELDAEMADFSQALAVHVEGAQTTDVELPVWVAP
jgi:hypothetical protein